MLQLILSLGLKYLQLNDFQHFGQNSPVQRPGRAKEADSLPESEFFFLLLKRGQVIL